MRLSRRVALLALLPSLVWAKTWKVDDDRSQCPNADFTKIQDAVDAASPGDKVRVCPGLYVESVNVDKPLTLEGSGPAAAFLRTGDPDSEAVVRPPPGGDGFTIETAETRVRRFTLWGQQDGVLEDAGIRTGPASSDDEIEFNAIWNFHDGIELRSNNQVGDRVFANVLKGPAGTTFNGVFGIHLISIRADTVVSQNVVRQYRIGVAADAGNYGTTPIGHLEIDENDISEVWDAIFLTLAEDTEVAGNQVSVDRGGISVTESTRVSILRNKIVGTGIQDFGIGTAINVFETSAFVVRGNDITHFTTPIEFNSAAIRLFGATLGRVEQNNVDGIQVGHGIALDAASSGNLVKGNTTLHTARDGLLVEAGSTGNTLAENVSFENGEFDAEDGNRSNNLWCRTRCNTDNPPGTICGQRDPGCP